MVRLEGHGELIAKGHWRPIIADVLRQIGAPYPLSGLEMVLRELYGGAGGQGEHLEDAEDTEGEEEEEGSGAEGGQGKRPKDPWKVSRWKAVFFFA
jgi:hypothetical protein